MSTPVVLVGYLVGLPSLLGLAFAGMLMFATGKAATQTTDMLRAESLSILEERGVPAPVISRVLAGPPLSTEELDDLPDDHRAAVRAVDATRTGQSIGTGLGAMLGGGASLCAGSASAMGLLMGLLLTMKRRVLQCSKCGAVVAAG
ncbi:MAG: hypothetical protein KIT58_00200 [Planctomycetota bacterium]|nr:hypothetical protein [Planctomycetota bacterium]